MLRTTYFPYIALCALLLPAGAHTAQHWVATWAVAEPVAASVTVAFIAAPPSVPPEKNSRALLPPVTAPTASFFRQTVRMVVHTSIGGDKVRLRFRSAYGAGALFWNVHLAIRDQDGRSVPNTDHQLSVLGGSKSFMVPAGAEIITDPVDLHVPSNSDLLVSIYFHLFTSPLTEYQYSLHTNYITNNDSAAAPELPKEATPTNSYFWLSGVDVLAPAETANAVVFGDSLAAGIGSSLDRNQDWPTLLAKRLKSVAVVNAGVPGARLLRDGPGVSALGRFDRDVLACPGVKWVIVQLGTQDIGMANLEHQEMEADTLIAGLRQILARAHDHGIRVIFTTIPPLGGSFFYRKKSVELRAELNEWIRHCKDCDAVIDFDSILRDPANPERLLPQFDSGDHYNPNDAGYQAMANAVDLKLFTR